MRSIRDKERIKQALENIGFSACFPEILPDICIYEYEKEELMVSPIQKNKNLLFFLEGYAAVYLLDEDGTICGVGTESAGTMIGDPELFLEDYTSVYVEAKTRVTALAIPYVVCRKEMEKNVLFLQLLIRQIILRENRHRQIHVNAGNNREKLLFYVKNLCQDGCIKNVTGAADAIHCSRRQVQRILKELCEEQILIRTEKGTYQFLKKDMGM